MGIEAAAGEQEIATGGTAQGRGRVTYESVSSSVPTESPSCRRPCWTSSVRNSARAACLSGVGAIAGRVRRAAAGGKGGERGVRREGDAGGEEGGNAQEARVRGASGPWKEVGGGYRALDACHQPRSWSSSSCRPRSAVQELTNARRSPRWRCVPDSLEPPPCSPLHPAGRRQWAMSCTGINARAALITVQTAVPSSM